jgi:signal peptidase I
MNTVLEQSKVKSFFKELGSLILVLLIAFSLRTFVFEPFYVPTGSLKPTVLEGDYLFSTKYSYGFSKYSLPFFIPLFEGRILFTQPARGDIIIFWPKDGEYRYVKRLIGLPNDKIQIVNGVIHINDKPIAKEEAGSFTSEDNVAYKEYKEILPNGVEYNIIEMEDPLMGQRYYNTEAVQVPAGNYFFMGDNRDNSNDSRVDLGFVPEENLISKAQFIFLSMKKQLFLPTWNLIAQIPRLLEIPSWLMSIRFDRMFNNLAN